MIILFCTREDGTKFGSLVDNYPPYGPFSLSVSVIPSVRVYYTKYNDVIPSVLVYYTKYNDVIPSVLV